MVNSTSLLQIICVWASIILLPEPAMDGKKLSGGTRGYSKSDVHVCPRTRRYGYGTKQAFKRDHVSAACSTEALGPRVTQHTDLMWYNLL